MQIGPSCTGAATGMEQVARSTEMINDLNKQIADQNLNLGKKLVGLSAEAKIRDQSSVDLRA